jgi:hypothetical protein
MKLKNGSNKIYNLITSCVSQLSGSERAIYELPPVKPGEVDSKLAPALKELNI